jgi:hypothetical protein
MFRNGKDGLVSHFASALLEDCWFFEAEWWTNSFNNGLVLGQTLDAFLFATLLGKTNCNWDCQTC